MGGGLGSRGELDGELGGLVAVVAIADSSWPQERR